MAQYPTTSLTLLIRARAGEADAWSRLVGLYSPLVHAWCRQRGVAASEADDVVQDVFLATATSLKSFRHDRPGDTFRGWLRGVAHNMIALHFRNGQKVRRAEGGSAAFEEIGQLAAADSATDNLNGEDDPGEIRELYRRAIDLVRHEFEDKTFQMFWEVTVANRSPSDVAAQFQVTSAAVHKAKSRFLRRLRQEIGDLPPDE